MFNIIGAYINRLTREDVRNFSLNKGAHFSEEEVNFTYDFIKKKKNNIYCIQCIFVNISIYTHKR